MKPAGIGGQLGRIQKHLLIFAKQKKKPSYYKVSKSGALLNYYRKTTKSTAPRHAANIRASIPRHEYQRLHSTFTAALKALERRGLIHYEPSPPEYTGSVELFTTIKKRGGSKHLRRSTYGLTEAGHRIATLLLGETS